MKLIKILLACFLIILAAYTILLIEPAKANPWTASPDWRVSSPQNNATYNRTYVNLDLRVKTQNNNNLYYSIDNHPEIPIRTRKGDLKPIPDSFEFKKVLNGLGEGKHTLALHHDIWFFSKYVLMGGSTITFYIDTTAPKITNLYINKTDTADWLLNFEIDENASWIGYSLDNQANTTINQGSNATLSGLSYGIHNVTVYAQDTVGHVGVSENLAFTVEKPEIEDAPDSPDLFPTMAVTLLVAFVAVSISVAVYVRKLKV